VRIGLLGGLRVEHDGRSIPVSGSMQLSVLFRLALDAGAAVGYRAISEDIWGMDAPENTRAALQSIVSRLRSQLPPGAIESTVGGYRLAIGRADVDAVLFADLVAAASASDSPDDAARIASEALELWVGEPWTPSENFDWFERDLRRDRERAVELGGASRAGEIPQQIPMPLTSLIGRETELATICDQRATNRLVTIIGAGGAGKTRLAMETAMAQRGALLVELAPVGPSELLAAVLSATGRDLRTREATAELATSRERVIEALFGREHLLVLDNCEHVIDAAARLAQDLLGALPQLRILATSREPLGVPGEAFVPLGSLRHPPESELPGITSESLAEYPALELYQQRATAARGRELDGDELVTAARICFHLDGLPLAIELAAAKSRTMPVDEVLSGLESRFTLLTGGFRTALPRHQTLRAMVDWSWSMLSADERTALSRIAVFPAGVSAPETAALASAMGLQSASAFDALVDRSLLQRSRGRYRALETIREYGIERLAEEGTLADARRTLVSHVAEHAVVRDRALRSPEVHDAIAWFDSEEDNITAALRYSTQAQLANEAVDLLGACVWYWVIRDRQSDARNWLMAVAPLAEVADGEEAQALRLLIPIINMVTALDEAPGDPREIVADVLGYLKTIPDVRIGAGGHEPLQLLFPVMRAFAAAFEEGDEGWMTRLTIPRGEELGLDPWPTAVLNVGRAAIAQNRAELAEQEEASLLALRQFEEIGDLWGLSLAQQMMAEWLTVRGRLEEALKASDDSTENIRRITSSWDLAQQQGLAISILLRLGRNDEARSRSDAMVAAADETENSRTMVLAYITAISTEVALGDVDRARDYLERYEELAGGWQERSPQLMALVENGRAGYFVLNGDFDAAEAALRVAVTNALESMDHPIIGQAALGLGGLALARGDVREAVRALDLSTAILGAYDGTSLLARAIEDAAVNAGIERSGTEVPDRPIAIEALKDFA
jgi:predicted ATPase